ncbi:MAG: hypothetical protein HYY93_16375 [Planctomycetes bacterium]|nr:hypothetical protein [Planctomycetota bacterium]
MPSSRLLVVLLVILLALSLAQIAVIAGLRDEVSTLSERMASLERPARPVPIRPASSAPEAIVGPGGGGRAATDDLGSTDSPAISASGARTPNPEGTEASDADTAGGDSAAGKTSISRADTLRANHPDPAGPTDEQIERIVEKTLSAKGQHRWMDDGKLKPPMNEYSRELGLTATQEADFLRTVDGGKREVFDLLRLPRPDGTSLAGDFVDIFRNPSGDPGQAAQKGGEAWMKLFSEKVPGRETTYIAEILTVQGRMKTDFQRTLTPEQMQRHLQSGVDPLDIKTGYDPFAEYLAEELKK